MATTTDQKTVNSTEEQQAAVPAVKWDTSGLHSSYANFCNANSTREEVVLNFGVNKSWERNQEALDIEIDHRIILSPFAAKRLTELLQKLMKEYEAATARFRGKSWRFGRILNQPYPCFRDPPRKQVAGFSIISFDKFSLESGLG